MDQPSGRKEPVPEHLPPLDVGELVSEHEGDLVLALLVRELEDVGIDNDEIPANEFRRERVKSAALLDHVDRGHSREFEPLGQLICDPIDLGKLVRGYPYPVSANVPHRPPVED